MKVNVFKDSEYCFVDTCNKELKELKYGQLIAFGNSPSFYTIEKNEIVEFSGKFEISRDNKKFGMYKEDIKFSESEGLEHFKEGDEIILKFGEHECTRILSEVIRNKFHCYAKINVPLKENGDKGENLNKVQGTFFFKRNRIKLTSKYLGDKNFANLDYILIERTTPILGFPIFVSGNAKQDAILANILLKFERAYENLLNSEKVLENSGNFLKKEDLELFNRNTKLKEEIVIEEFKYNAFNWDVLKGKNLWFHFCPEDFVIHSISSICKNSTRVKIIVDGENTDYNFTASEEYKEFNLDKKLRISKGQKVEIYLDNTENASDLHLLIKYQ